MNLIEQLGGYEKALDLFRGCPWDSGTVDVPNPRSKGMLRLDLGELRSELLKYRRQHNIFEVGDKVVYLSGIAPDHNDIYELSKIGEMYHVLKIGVMDYNAKFNHIRHTTEAEIKAGRRL